VSVCGRIGQSPGRTLGTLGGFSRLSWSLQLRYARRKLRVGLGETGDDLMQPRGLIAATLQLSLKKHYAVLLAFNETLQYLYLRLILDSSTNSSNPDVEVST
jgi:hypothetical protein